MLKLSYIDRIETKLHKAEIEEKVREIVLEDHFFNIFTAGKNYAMQSLKTIYTVFSCYLLENMICCLHVCI